MALVVYNSLSRAKEEFVPMRDSKVNMFVCGQTVYDDAHIGHSKTYINFAVIARWLRYSSYEVKYAQNITDVDDKIISRAREAGTDAKTLAEKYEKRLLEDFDALRIKKDADIYPRSHDYIDAVVKQIQQLLDKGFAYPLDGDVYYDVAKFKDYTKLSGMKIGELSRHRVEPKPGKRNVYDFSLWKAAKEGEPSWTIIVTEKGKRVELKGRPGWHIEDTAMTSSIFGEQYDLHGGAMELMFPHHTNEIAQAEAASGKKPFVKYWLHSGVLNIKGEKMAKSLKNFITIREFLKSYDAETLKMLVCSTHYRKEIDYTDQLAKEAQKRARSMSAAFSIFYNSKEAQGSNADEINTTIELLEVDFAQAMNDDFNTPLAAAIIMKSIIKLRDLAESGGGCDTDAKENAAETVVKLARILGLLENGAYKEKLPEEARRLIKEREALRKSGSFAKADEVRNKVREEYGLVLEDTESGTIWYRA